MLHKRALMSAEEAAALRGLFQVLADETRLRLLHAIARAGEQSVTKLAESLQMTPQAASNQLRRLADRGILRATRNGNHRLYRIVDPCVTALLDRGWCLAEDAGERRRR